MASTAIIQLIYMGTGAVEILLNKLGSKYVKRKRFNTKRSFYFRADILFNITHKKHKLKVE